MAAAGRLTREDLDAILERAARRPDGSYRVLASRNIAGRPLGPFRYYGTRPDDPNDIVPHEHRRELRGLSVFSAWLNHDEVRSSNSHDSVVAAGQPADRPPPSARFRIDARQRQRQGAEPPRRQRVRVGVAADADHDADARALRAALDQGAVSGYSGGRADSNRPTTGPRTGSPTTRTRRSAMRGPTIASGRPASSRPSPTKRWPRWCVRRSSPIPGATEYLTKTLLERRTKVLNAWLNGTNPVVDLALSETGELTFANAATRAGVAKPAEKLHGAAGRASTTPPARLTRSATSRPSRSQGPRRPRQLLAAKPEYISVEVRAFHPDQPAWSQPLSAYFRRTGDRWTLVGLDRNP